MTHPKVFENNSALENQPEPGPVPSRPKSDFFKGVGQATVSCGGYTAPLPLFYYDYTTLMALFLTPLDRIRALLPSPVMHPLRLTPWHGITMFLAFEYRDTDIGPYNEFGILFPITLHKPAPVLTGFLKAMNEGPMGYVWKLPVTTEIARYMGVELAGYPKFLADIKFEQQAGWIGCRVAEGDQHLLTLRVRETPLQEGGRMRMDIANIYQDRIVHIVANNLLPQFSISRNPANVHLELGNHPVAQQLRALNLGRLVECRYSPQCQLILSQILESFPIR